MPALWLPGVAAGDGSLLPPADALPRYWNPELPKGILFPVGQLPAVLKINCEGSLLIFFNLGILISFIPPSPQVRKLKKKFILLFLPSMRKKPALADGSNPDGDLLQEHWLVDDMFIFENVGFTKDVGNIKFLVCADCEIGPIGWHCLDDKKSFYVALERVSHE
ncbi:guanine nucleotide exchange factor MSS4 isoform X1 [Diceros bicornis minor]|uniref:guanine nucleotide exchange factor MSS4 isoform X1 n=1 Tax=Diceros bicornis minor TaxID=77932 RepID=UPI0026F358D2|nr:guanine nucleotide exchange factor MSS4 isoform X1 [Diceros bicornis minor]